MIRAVLVSLAMLLPAGPAAADPGATSVLVDTDVLPLSDFETALPASLRAGSYAAETGGAILEITLTPGDGDRWQLIRLASEPGEEPERAEYLLAPEGGELVSRGAMVRLRVLADGALLVLEPEQEGPVPSGLWVLYTSR